MLASILIVLVTLILLYINLIKIKERQTQSFLEQEASKVESILLKKFDDTALVIDRMGEEILKKPHNKYHIKRILEKYRQDSSLKEIFSWTIFSWSNAKSHIIVDGKYGVMKKPYDLSNRDYIPVAVANPGKIILGKPVYGSTSKKWMIPGGVSMVDQKGKLKGTITIGFEIEDLTKIIQKELVDDSIQVKLSYAPEKYVFMVEKSKIKIFGNDDHEAEESQFVTTLKKPLKDYQYEIIVTHDERATTRVLWDLMHFRFLEIMVMFFLMMVLIIIFVKGEIEKKNKIKLLSKISNSKNQLSVEVSRELENFTLAIMGLSKLAKGNIDKKEEVISHLEHIDEIGQELMSFSTDLVDLNLPEDGDFKISPLSQEIDFEDLIYRTLRILKSKSKDKKITINTEFEESLPAISNLDPRRMKQIMVSLIGNAIKFSDDSFIINIFVKRSGNNNISITIQDYGVGMDETQIKKSLRDYHKHDYEMYSENCSIELKLPIVRFLVEQQGGSIDITSLKGEGSNVNITFQNKAL